MKKFILSMAGAASLLASASILIDYGTRKAAGKNAHPAELTAGITGAVAGVTLAVLGELNLPTFKKKQKEAEEIDELALCDVLTEEDFALLEEGAEASVEAEAEEALPAIELDEEATIEDFIEK